VLLVCAAMLASVCLPQHASCGFWCVVQLGYSGSVVVLIADGCRGIQEGVVVFVDASCTQVVAVQIVHAASNRVCGCFSLRTAVSDWQLVGRLREHVTVCCNVIKRVCR
jgi:hypothetical protein